MKKPLVLPDSPHLKDVENDGRLNAPSAARNMPHIKAVLSDILPEQGNVLELASGTGQHIADFAAQWPGLTWHPSDVSEERHDSVRAWAAQAGLSNLRDVQAFDAISGWGDHPTRYDFIYVVNLLHLISTADAANVLAGMAGALKPGGRVMVYGPFRDHGAFRSAGDADFHARLTSQDPDIGYKDAHWVQEQLNLAGLVDPCEIKMPANNLILHARRA
ncbi:DUF938 domain-containing protein [Halocynthiibacter namhaensis]|uniref:DUF938 domain-containing protein n=1 Tax=Halocynthiibacter namhaensis TaxID=1290553 RepID=UPI0005794254|nr:DUF938 domain-containing protein [Halocynthiibacter namhaensis]